MMPADPPQERDPERGFGPVIVDDDGNKHQVTETEALDAAACAAGMFLAMGAWDFSAHEEWIIGERHYWFGTGIRMIVRIAGLASAAAIWIMVAREARAREREAQETRALNGRSFVSGKTPGRDEHE